MFPAGLRFAPTSGFAMRILLILFGILALVPPGDLRAQEDSVVYELHQVEVLPRPQNAAEFAEALRQRYPAPLREAGVGGTVQVSFVVGADGTVEQVRVLSASDSALAAPSAQALSVLRFTPAQVGGRPVAVRVEQPLQWSVAVPAGSAEEAEEADVAEAAEAAKKAAAAAAPDTGRVYEISAVTEVPRPISTSAFAQALARGYPPFLRNAGRSGEVVVRFIVNEAGRVRNARVLRSSDRAFDAPTLEAVRHLRFHPARLNGHPVRVWVELPVAWTTGGAPAGMPPRP